MIDIICLKWGTKFGPEYVNNLYSGIARNTTVDFRFHCFTDDVTGVRPEVFCHDLPKLNITGWWYKLWLFSNELRFNPGDRIMFFDLNTLVTGNIDDILSHECDKNLTGLRNFYRPQRFASGLLMWRHGTQTHIWEKFKADPQGAQQQSPDGDQEWTERCATEYHRWQEIYPDCIYSYKQSCSRGLPGNAKIVCYHGTPSIIQSFTETVKNYDGTWPPQQWPLEHWKHEV